jgi:hypothetical protein
VLQGLKSTSLSNNAKKNTKLIEEYLLTIEVVLSDLEILKKSGELKTVLRSAGNILSDADIFIAATTLAKCNMLIYLLFVCRSNRGINNGEYRPCISCCLAKTFQSAGC